MVQVANHAPPKPIPIPISGSGESEQAVGFGCAETETQMRGTSTRMRTKGPRSDDCNAAENRVEGIYECMAPRKATLVIITEEVARPVCRNVPNEEMLKIGETLCRYFWIGCECWRWNTGAIDAMGRVRVRRRLVSTSLRAAISFIAAGIPSCRTVSSTSVWLSSSSRSVQSRSPKTGGS